MVNILVERKTYFINFFKYIRHFEANISAFVLGGLEMHVVVKCMITIAKHTKRKWGQRQCTRNCICYEVEIK